MRLRRPVADLGVAAEVEQQIAVSIALERIEPRVFGLPLRLQPLRLLKERFRPRALPA